MCSSSVNPAVLLLVCMIKQENMAFVYFLISDEKSTLLWRETDYDSSVLIPSCGNFCEGSGVPGAYPEREEWGGVGGVERAQAGSETSKCSPEAWHIQGRVWKGWQRRGSCFFFSAKIHLNLIIILGKQHVQAVQPFLHSARSLKHWWPFEGSSSLGTTIFT